MWCIYHPILPCFLLLAIFLPWCHDRFPYFAQISTSETFQRNNLCCWIAASIELWPDQMWIRRGKRRCSWLQLSSHCTWKSPFPHIQNKTEVNDPLGQWGSKDLFSFGRFSKWGRTDERTESCVKTIITTGSDCGSEEWINISYLSPLHLLLGSSVLLASTASQWFTQCSSVVAWKTPFARSSTVNWSMWNSL